jgi:hypothetical protein
LHQRNVVRQRPAEESQSLLAWPWPTSDDNHKVAAAAVAFAVAIIVFGPWDGKVMSLHQEKVEQSDLRTGSQLVRASGMAVNLSAE